MLLRQLFSRFPVIARAAPFIVFVLLTAAQGEFGADSAYWFYLAKTIVGAWLVLEMAPVVAEMRWAFSWEALAVGVGIFAVWVGADQYYPHTGELLQNYLFPFFKKIGLGFLCSEAKPVVLWNPHLHFGGALAGMFIVVRILGSTWIVPPLEEVFFRSFLYRYVARQNFLEVPLNRFLPVPFFVTAIVFGFEHDQWLAGIVCGMAYQWLVLRKNRLGDAMTAHAITNFLLGLCVVWRGAWNFW
jgi:uncharacterized protein